MAKSEADVSLPEPRRKEIFLALVDVQDGGASVAQLRALIAERFGVSEQQLRAIEREGVANDWPPL